MKLTLLLTITACAIAGFVYFTYLTLTHEESAENVAAVSWLPAAATHISYYRSYSFTAYEFDIQEGEFLKWSDLNGWPAVLVNGNEVAVYRHFMGGGRLKYPSDPPGPISGEVQRKLFEEQAEYRRKQIHRFSNGFYYDHRTSNGGGFTVGYDRDLQRAYYQSSPR